MENAPENPATKASYAGLFAYAKKNPQNRNLYQEYWQQGTSPASAWHSKLTPQLERSAPAANHALKLPAEPAPAKTRQAMYEGLTAYALANAVATDLFKTQAHPNLKDWQASLRYEKGHQLAPSLKKVA